LSAERFFLDTAYVQALVNARDQHHPMARALLQRLRTASEVWVTEAVLTVDALTPDEHFQQAGFRALLRQDIGGWKRRHPIRIPFLLRG
jgi:predicted nucleic acid-binding protein